MNSLEFINPLPVVISVGNYDVFADSVKINGSSVLNEQSGVSGNSIITNSSIKNTVVTVSGRLASDSDFTSFVVYAENILRNKISVNFEYKNICCNSCILKSYSAENKDSGVTEIKLVFTVPSLTEVTENAG